MSTNVFFNNFDSYAEKNLIEDLIIESIRIYGHDMYYCPRTIVGENTIFNEDAVSEYNTHYLVEMYIKNVEGFEGEGDFLSKFNIEIRDNITFTLARRVYDEEIGVTQGNVRPYEGDIIFMPLTGKVYQIKFVEHESVFYQMGALQTYDLKCELFEYSNERLNTGVPIIDDLEQQYSLNVDANGAYADANGNIIMDANTGRPLGIGSDDGLDNDAFADNATFETDADLFIDFSEKDPFSQGGTF